MGKCCFIMALLSRSQIKLSIDTVNMLYFPNAFEIELDLEKSQSGTFAYDNSLQ